MPAFCATSAQSLQKLQEMLHVTESAVVQRELQQSAFPPVAVALPSGAQAADRGDTPPPPGQGGPSFKALLRRVKRGRARAISLVAADMFDGKRVVCRLCETGLGAGDERCKVWLWEEHEEEEHHAELMREWTLMRRFAEEAEPFLEEVFAAACSWRAPFNLFRLMEAQFLQLLHRARLLLPASAPRSAWGGVSASVAAAVFRHCLALPGGPSPTERRVPPASGELMPRTPAEMSFAQFLRALQFVAAALSDAAPAEFDAQQRRLVGEFLRPHAPRRRPEALPVQMGPTMMWRRFLFNQDAFFAIFAHYATGRLIYADNFVQAMRTFGVAPALVSETLLRQVFAGAGGPGLSFCDFVEVLGHCAFVAFPPLDVRPEALLGSHVRTFTRELGVLDPERDAARRVMYAPRLLPQPDESRIVQSTLRRARKPKACRPWAGIAAVNRYEPPPPGAEATNEVALQAHRRGVQRARRKQREAERRKQEQQRWFREQRLERTRSQTLERVAWESRFHNPVHSVPRHPYPVSLQQDLRASFASAREAVARARSVEPLVHAQSAAEVTVPAGAADTPQTEERFEIAPGTFVSIAARRSPRAEAAARADTLARHEYYAAVCSDSDDDEETAAARRAQRPLQMSRSLPALASQRAKSTLEPTVAELSSASPQHLSSGTAPMPRRSFSASMPDLARDTSTAGLGALSASSGAFPVQYTAASSDRYDEFWTTLCSAGTLPPASALMTMSVASLGKEESVGLGVGLPVAGRTR